MPGLKTAQKDTTVVCILQLKHNKHISQNNQKLKAPQKIHPFSCTPKNWKFLHPKKISKFGPQKQLSEPMAKISPSPPGPANIKKIPINYTI